MPLEYDDVTPTDEQAAILDDFEAGKHLAVTALAGTGKTSTLRMCGETIRRKRGIYLAFNKSIADEASDTFPMRVTCRTAHSFAFRAFGHQYKDRLSARRMPPWDVASVLGIPHLELNHDITIRPVRAASLVREMVGRFCHSSDEEITRFHVPFVRGLEFRVDKETDVVYEDQHGDLAEMLLPFAQEYWKDISLLAGQFRFEHDHYLKMWCLGHPSMEADFILVDEAQDLNGVLVGLVEDQDMQKVIVGDANQQIYEWRGSLNAMEVFPVDATLPLTQSWRFGPEIAAAANVFLEQLGAELRIRGNPDKVSSLERIGQPDAVLCRTNAGCLEMAMGYMLNGLKVASAGGRMAELTSFFEAVEQMQRGNMASHPDLQAFSTWSQVVEYTKTTRDPEFTTQVVLVEKYGVKALLSALRSLVPPRAADVTVSTAHGAKGLEWGEVKLGHDFAPRPSEDPEARITEGETRLRYVAVTRAMDKLDPGPLAVDLGMEEAPADPPRPIVQEGSDEWDEGS